MLRPSPVRGGPGRERSERAELHRCQGDRRERSRRRLNVDLASARSAAREAAADLHDLPDPRLERVASGHFAVEDCLEEISTKILRFYDSKVRPAALQSRVA